MEDFSEFPFREYLETMCMMESKLYEMEEIFEEEFGPQRVQAYIPLADRFNHSHESNAEYSYDHNRKGFVVKAGRDIKMDEEICVRYTAEGMDNYEFFKAHGYVYQANPHD
jgi:hypothetical protein